MEEAGSESRAAGRDESDGPVAASPEVSSASFFSSTSLPDSTGKASGFSVDPLALLHASLKKSASSASCRLEVVRGEEALVFPELNCYLPATLPSGLESRRKESFSLADIFLLLSTPKELYTYSYIAQKGHRYINVLERSKIVSFFESLSPAANKLAGSAGAPLPAPVGHSGLGDKSQLPSSVFAPALGDAAASRTQTLLVLDPTLPIKLPGALEGAQGQHLDGDSRGEEGLPFWEAGERSLVADDRLEKVMPQAWPDADVRQVALYAKTAVHALDEMRRKKREAGAQSGENDGGADGQKRLKTGSEEAAEDEEQEEKAEQRMRDALASLVFARVQRPLVQRCSAVQLTGFSFDAIFQKFVEVEKERNAGRSLAAFSHSKGDGSDGLGRFKADSSIARLPRHGGGGRADNQVPSAAAAAGRREGQGKPRICVLEEVYAYRKRKAIILIPPVTSVGGSNLVSALLNRYNVVDLLENSQFVSPQDARERAARDGTLGADQGRLEVRHEIRNKQFKFMLVETSYAAKFTPEQWKCVVAIIINVASASSLKLHFGGWPFRDWIDLFLSYKGVMFAYEEDAIPPEVASLSVKVIRLSRSHRYNDAAAATEFWACLEEFLLQPRRLCLAFDRRLDAARSDGAAPGGSAKLPVNSSVAGSQSFRTHQRSTAAGASSDSGSGVSVHPAHQHHFHHPAHMGVGMPSHAKHGAVGVGGYNRRPQDLRYAQR
ncbi:RNA polymerase II accessory factor CDC73 [Toxoplasma gondii TgCatPRC2]|uniref:RNA polymerase II accessory factor CDC73 n=3 Tax=Toxoplasma gondii TaxID=5811 RepID=B6KRB0_TOXGV|nr:RNA polymerase II accessory factor CDC73 [Toxoplasma gondii ME49]EPT27444.1 RNA polymerase II accessory factor CDC73 [Toxoplasma gondii ME49]ESS29001.1 RNA polymerase II accessory factor CDC73 [Toxoplasma gondii VEG]KYK64641.1 RNA polymerase II accessory factor CDC73 [Toxoplasma gondii TgCatPRC2]CEL76260.1 TPA: RNA polymerase II assessory factor CDC73 [Toxoplasma gondii VEG]|eukprot:XP_002370383.1 RNA polymerase II accessory factor CDC73 [Toxoplasma gondii ME49]